MEYAPLRITIRGPPASPSPTMLLRLCSPHIDLERFTMTDSRDNPDRLHVILMTRQRVHRHSNIQADVFLFQCNPRNGRAIR